MRQMVPLEEAQKLLLNVIQPLEAIEVDLLQARGMALGEDIIAPHPLPPFDRSPLDGYALRAADTTGACKEKPVALQVVESIHAGQLSRNAIQPGTAVAITTGAPIPAGTDCVIRFEDTRREGETVFIPYPLSAGENVVQAGEDIAAGEVALPAGRTVDASAVGMLAALGYGQVKVHRRPRVAVFSTGDELLSPGEPLLPGKIYNSNLYAVASEVAEAGGEALLLESVPDETEPVAEQFRRGLSTADLVISTGGVSVGERDVVKEAMVKAGAQIIFWKVGLKPGTPVVCAQKDGRLLIGLSGNPAAAMIVFILLVRPVLLRLGGHRDLFLPRVKARMAEAFPKGGKQRRFVRAQVWWQDDGFLARPAGLQSPGALRSLVEGNALIDVPAGHGPLKPGETVEVILLS